VLPVVASGSRRHKYSGFMTVAGEVLSKTQRKLWKRLDAGERLDKLSDDELRDWIVACGKLVAHADRSPARAAKSRRMWQGRLRDAEAAMDRRLAER
jgi:hypothetical protein